MCHGKSESCLSDIGCPLLICLFQLQELIRIDGDHSKVFGAELTLQLDQMRRDLDTGGAARKPEVDQMVLSFELRRRNLRTVELYQGKPRRILSCPARQGPIHNLSEAPVLLDRLDIDTDNLTALGIAFDELGHARITIYDG